MKRLMGRTDVEDALRRLDKLTQEETRTTVAENLAVAHSIKDSASISAHPSADILCVNNVSHYAAKQLWHESAFEAGFLHRILPQITTLLGVLIMTALQHGSSTAIHTKNGNRTVPFCGCTENVTPIPHVSFCCSSPLIFSWLHSRFR
jgi:hypothetical protein